MNKAAYTRIDEYTISYEESGKKRIATLSAAGIEKRLSVRFTTLITFRINKNDHCIG
jgi:hypothetical protein